MITENEYLNAIEVVKKYKQQIEEQTKGILLPIEENPLYLLKKGQKIRLTKVAQHSTSNIGDVFEVFDCYYNDCFNLYPIVVFINKNGYKSRISKQKNWDYEVLS